MGATKKSMQNALSKMSGKLELSNEDYKNSLYIEVKHVEQSILDKMNKKKSWEYGFNEEHDFVCISKDGTVGKFIQVQGLIIGLPKASDNIEGQEYPDEEQYWRKPSSPNDNLLRKLSSISQLSEMEKKDSLIWENYINQEWDRRDEGYWFMVNGSPTYITGSHYFFLRWAKIDVGSPDYRDSNRIFFYWLEACRADERCYGMCYLKNRRSGFSFMAASETVNQASMSSDSHYGILSKTGADAKSLFTGKIVRIANNLPFFFKPIRAGESQPKTEILYNVPSTKLTKKRLDNLLFEDDEVQEGLDTKIDWKNTGDNSYDGEKLALLVHDESGKWTAPDNILKNWNITKTCLRVGLNEIVGLCMMGSTCNKQKDGGSNFKQLYYDSHLLQGGRNKNGQTPSGLYALFIPMEWNVQDCMDKYGFPVFTTPEEPVYNLKGKRIREGAIEFWDNEIEGFRNNQESRNEHYRQYPRTEAHAFRDEITGAIFNIEKIYEQINHNEELGIPQQIVQRGNFYWANGMKDTEVRFAEDPNGRFKVSWLPDRRMQNNVIEKNGTKYPGNEEFGAFGCDSYDISGTVYGSGSNGALHGLTSFTMVETIPSNTFFLEYVARPATAEIFFEEVLMACVFYGMPILVENNKPRLLYHFLNRGYRGFSMNRPDRHKKDLSKTEKEIGGIPNTSEDIKQTHAASIGSYIEEYIGIVNEEGECGTMPFMRTLDDWLKFEIDKRTNYDASISSGLAIMATRRHLFLKPKQVTRKAAISPFTTYDNSGRYSVPK